MLLGHVRQVLKTVCSSFHFFLSCYEHGLNSDRHNLWQGGNMVWSRSEETADVDEDLLDIGPLLEDDMLLNDDNFMSLAFE